MKWIINSLEDINNVAAEFLNFVGTAKVFALHGDMGVGKTTFIKAVGTCLGVTDDVSSPTFAIINEYSTAQGEAIYHFDFYRVNSIEEAFDFGCEEYLYSGNRCFLEWPDKVKELLPADIVHCYFTELPDGKREITINE